MSCPYFEEGMVSTKKFLNKRRKVIGLIFHLVLLSCAFSVKTSAQDVNIEMPNVVQLASIDNDSQKVPTRPIVDMDQIPKIESTAAKDYNDNGVIYAQKGEYDLAIAEFNKSIDSDPGLAETYNNRAIVYSKKGQYDLSIADFTKAIEIDPYKAKAYYNRGITYAIRGQYDLALSDINKSLQLQPVNAQAYDTLGSMHIEMACSEWKVSCKFGDCDHLNKATMAGLCSEEGHSILLP